MTVCYCVIVVFVFFGQKFPGNGGMSRTAYSNTHAYTHRARETDPVYIHTNLFGFYLFQHNAANL